MFPCHGLPFCLKTVLVDPSFIPSNDLLHKILTMIINPLMLELNAPVQHCLQEFFTGDFKFLCLLLEEKAYLIDFSFKFNETKFCCLLMNWLIWKKNFTYFYNKFRPVNHMHYIKCGVNSSLLP